MNNDKPLLLAIADVHLSENAPSFRSSEPSWFAAMARQLRWLKQLVKDCGCPLVVAGDIFDRSTGSTRLINFAIDEFPFAYSVAGNHDLPYQNINKLDISSYGSLMRAKKLFHIDNVLRLRIDDIVVALHGFSCNTPPRPCVKQGDIDIAVIHEFVWTGTSPIAKFILNSHVSNRLKQYPGYDYYIFGDNHGPFIDGNVINCGAFYRRVKGAETYQPTVVALYRDHIDRIPVPVDEDKFVIRVSEKTKREAGYDFTEFFESLRKAETLTCDVRKLLQDYLNTHEVSEDVKTAIISITES